MASVAMDYDSRKGLIPMCKVVETIDRPIESVWALCSAFGAIKGWMPGIESCVVREDKPIPPAYGAVRAVANLGMVMEETLEIFDVKNHFISYRLQDPCPWPLRGCRGSLKLEALNETKTQVTWSSDAEEISQETIEETRPQLDAFFKSGIAEARKILMRPQQVYIAILSILDKQMGKRCKTWLTIEKRPLDDSLWPPALSTNLRGNQGLADSCCR